jgi:hypothetical protein
MTKKQESKEDWEWEVELPSGFVTAVGTVTWAILPHLPLLHAWLVAIQISLPSTRDKSR